MDSSMRYFGSAVGFGFGAVWMTAGIGSAIACLLVAALGYGAVFMAERAQANGISRRPAHEMPDPELELGHDATSPLAAEAEYGWPWPTEKPEAVDAENRA